MKTRRIVVVALIPACLLVAALVGRLSSVSPPAFGQATKEDATKEDLQKKKEDLRKKVVAGRRNQPGTDMRLYSPGLHQLYDGKFRLDFGKTYMVGGLFDKPGWDHIDNQAKTVHAVTGTVTVDVDELKNTGRFVAKLKLPEGELVMVMDRFHEFQPCQDGGITSMVFEHGDSGCGDANYPKTLLYLAGWGYADATLNGKPLYKDYQAHFMVTQGMRDRKTLKVTYPVLNKKTPAGQVNPAAMQLDFYIRSKAADSTNKNNPPKKDFAHFFCMEVTWK